MCIAILQDNSPISRNTLKRCHYAHPDGMGLAYIENNQIKIFKELKSFNKFYKFYRKISSNPPIMLHFRKASDGPIDRRNCHPFFINKDAAFCHNGILKDRPAKDADHSDTILFSRTILRKLPRDFLNNEGIIALISKYINWSKLIFLTSDGSYKIINEEEGVWDGSNWYSNTTYKPPPKNTYNNKNNYLKTRHKTDWPYNYEDNYSEDYYNNYLKTQNKTYICKYCHRKLAGPGTMCTDCYNKNNNHLRYDNLFCKYCGTQLYSTQEKKEHTCKWCRNNETEYCSYCGIELTTEQEKRSGQCYYCEANVIL